MDAAQTLRISNLVIHAGGRLAEIRKGEGVIIIDPVTNSHVAVPLDPFFSERNSDAINAVRAAILCCRAYFNAPKLAKERLYANMYEELCTIAKQIDELTIFIKEPRGLERINTINARVGLLKHYLETE